MGTGWSKATLDTIESSEEIRITAPRGDGTLPDAVPIWAVCSGDAVYVRTWYRRTSGWFGRAVSSKQARIIVDGNGFDTLVDDVADDPAVRAEVDAAYGAKYGRYGSGSAGQMASDDAAATTLRLTPA
ncbi:DUF2255 family protein [Gordonia sp. DT30]|uniref:DUF2255 family protein n=1 Tax=unclassified Gordonia (in: high G+C Gram-positive bacteria) TaxID=2657482 RepID=UPI003CF22C92